jgi:hypothetical protein
MLKAPVLAATLLAVVATALAPSASATNSRETKVGEKGQRVTVMQTENLDPQGQRVVVRGRKFDPRVGVYVALCVMPKRGQAPSPCGGGVDLQGASGASAWISSNPPPYARSLVQPFGKKGSFRAVITVSSRIGDVDCREVKCAITVRADHLRSRDRSHDVIIPVTFE